MTQHVNRCLAGDAKILLTQKFFSLIRRMARSKLVTLFDLILVNAFDMNKEESGLRMIYCH